VGGVISWAQSLRPRREAAHGRDCHDRGQPFKKREPLGVLGLLIITLGMYWFYWYYKINDESAASRRMTTCGPTSRCLPLP
jgi:hypothetical protein